MQLFYRKYGEGEPVIILHGLYGSSDNWIGIAKLLAPKYKVFLPDQRNHGNSPHANSHTYPDLKNDLKNFMDEQNIEKAVIVGHSMGGKTALFFAAEFPERVKTLVVVDISPKNYFKLSDFTKQTIHHTDILNFLQDFDLELIHSRKEAEKLFFENIKEKKIIQFLLKNLKRNRDNRFSWKINIPVIRRDIRHILDGLDMDKYKSGKDITKFPVLFIKGEKSNYILEDDILIIQAIFPKAEITTIPDATHWLHAEQPELLVKTLLYFLD